MFFLSSLNGSSISEYSAPFSSEQNNMASSYVYVTEEPFFNKRSRCLRHLQKTKEIWQLSFQRYVFLLFSQRKCTRDVWKCLVYKWVDNKPKSRKIVKILQKCVKRISRGICWSNYSPQCRWIMVDIYRATKRLGKYPPVTTIHRHWRE